MRKSQLGTSFLSMAVLLVLAVPADALGSRPPVTEFPLQTKRIGGIAQGPDGTVAYAGTVGTRDHWEGRIGWVGPAGPIGEVAVPDAFPGEIAVGTEGDAWFLTAGATVGRVTRAGVYSQAAIAAGEDFPGYAAAAQGGGIWFTKGRGSFGADTVGRIAANAAVSEFALPNSESRPMAIVEAQDGHAWFTEYFGDRIGRIAPGGALTEFPLPAGSRPAGITGDRDGNVWFTEQGSGKIGRIDSSGSLTEFKLPAGVVPGAIAAASDGRLWFTENPGRLARLTPAGRFSEVRLPNRESSPVDIVAGAEGAVWYAAMGEGPCEGGGGTCMFWEPPNPAIVGRVTPTPLTTALTAQRVVVKHHRAPVRLACEGGEASDRCVGRIELKLGGRVVADARYSLAADQRKEIPVRLRGDLAAALRRDERVRVKALALASHGRSSRRMVVVTPDP